jgi:hypothetical protein
MKLRTIVLLTVLIVALLGGGAVMAQISPIDEDGWLATATAHAMTPAPGTIIWAEVTAVPQPFLSPLQVGAPMAKADKPLGCIMQADSGELCFLEE